MKLQAMFKQMTQTAPSDKEQRAWRKAEVGLSPGCFISCVILGVLFNISKI